MSRPFWGVAATAVAPSRVIVRDPFGKDPELARPVLGTKTGEALLFGVLFNCEVTFDSGTVRLVPPAWVRPAIDFVALLNLPRLDQAAP